MYEDEKDDVQIPDQDSDMDIFVDEDELFPITVYYRVIREDGRKVRIECSVKPQDGDDWKRITGEFCQPSSQAFGDVMEKATIINHVDFRPLLRTWSLRDGVILRFMKSWDAKTGKMDGEGNPIPVAISQRNISNLHYDISSSFFIEYMNKAGLSAELNSALKDEQFIRKLAREKMSVNEDVEIPDFGEAMRGRDLPEDLDSIPVPTGFPIIMAPESE